MLNIAPLKDVNYHLGRVASGAEDYYLGLGEAPGIWRAEGGVEAFGLSGEVESEPYLRLLRGEDPNTGESLSSRQGGLRVPGFDLTFRAPKSVSLLWALGDGQVAQEVREAHEAAVEAAMRYMERQAARARRGAGGVTELHTSGLVAAYFRHRSSRAGDPVLHTHVVVANVVRGTDGRWSGLNSRLLYPQAKTTGYLYQAHLRHELSTRLGVAWSPVRNGLADIEGIPESLRTFFSNRRAEILEHMATRGESSAKAAQFATLETRRGKSYHVDAAGLEDGWKRQAADLGFGPEEVAAVLHRRPPPREPTLETVRDLGLELAGATGLTARASTFSRRDALRGWCEALVTARVEDVERVADGWLGGDDVVALGETGPLRTGDVLRLASGQVVPAKTDGERYSTQDMLATERALVGAAVARDKDRVGIASTSAVEEALASRQASAEQKDMVRKVTSSEAGVVVVRGHAGAGKTHALHACRAAWEASGVSVRGVSLAAETARQLEVKSGIASTTVAALLAKMDRANGAVLPSDGVLVIDEAAMVGTRHLERVLRQARNDRCKVVLVGDDHQLYEIDAGGGFRGLRKRLGSVELTQNWRQRNQWEQEALGLLRKGEAEPALRAYAEHDRIIVAESREDCRARMVADWMAAKAAGDVGMVVAPTHADIDALNKQIRGLLVDREEVTDPQLKVAGLEFGVGDLVITGKNDMHRLGVRNGMRWQVTGVNRERVEVSLRNEEATTVTLPRSYLEGGHLTHGYATTFSKAQGKTSSLSFVLVDEQTSREWVYMAMSRATEANFLYVSRTVVEAQLEDDIECVGTTKPPLLVALESALQHSAAKRLAIDTPPPPVLGDLATTKQREYVASRGHDLPAEASWVRASIAIDQLQGQPAGEFALTCLVGRGLSPEAALERVREGLQEADIEEPEALQASADSMDPNREIQPSLEELVSATEQRRHERPDAMYLYEQVQRQREDADRESEPER